MTTMIERVAQAIYAKNAAAAAGRLPWAKAQDATKESVRDLARAAIEEMRNHTPEMDSAGYDAYPDSIIRTNIDHLDIYRAMIDAALKEEKA